ncbi:MAG: DNA-protecting protein DprA [Deltaproteobacteria bacterium]|jgi:DNA processing protein|nr:DNA-protecting protein DprA [Deltaproteobacteria bacterium]
MDRDPSPALLDPSDPTPGVGDLLRLWLSLQAAFAWAPQEIAGYLVGGESPEALANRFGVRLLSPRESARRAQVLARDQVRLLPITSPLYPARLRRLSDAPPLLAVRGQPSVLAARGVAIVGARAATVSGRQLARDLGHDLARAGLVVVSGLARGIDRAAHEGALDAGGFTVALQACGPDLTYPPEHRALADRIASSGGIVSELPLGSPPRAPHFPLRNRLISALAEAVVVVEARLRSGSLVTARHAADQGVDVLAVPGPVNAATSRGPHQLLREGAGLVEDARDVLAALGWPGDFAPPAHGNGGVEACDPLERAILDALATGPITPEALATALERRLPELAEALLELELRGEVGTDRDGQLCRLGRSQG